MLSTLFFFSGVMSFLFLSASSPVLMVILVIISSFNICIIMKTMFFSAWFSYILFLIFLGGLMVVFVYICSLASNEQISTSHLPSILALTAVLVVALTFFLPPGGMMFNILTSLQSMYSLTNSWIIYTTMFYLLLTLFVAVQLSKMKFGPMRAKKN